MSHSSYSIAFLSANEEVYQQLQSLLRHTKVELFHLTWIDLTEAPSLENLPHYDAYLSDAPLLYLIQQSDFVAQRPFFWITETDSVRNEILHWGVLDCFLTAELTSGLLEHSLRICFRQAQSTKELSPLTEFEGDRFRTLVQNIPGVVYRCLHTQEWQGMYISEAIEDLLGYPAADFAADGDRNFVSVIHPSDRDLVERVIDQQIQLKKPFNLEYRLIHRDGTIKWVDERGQGVFDELGNLLWLDGVIIDISEKKAIANELNRQVLSSYEKTPAMLHSIDPAGKIIAVSDQWLKVMGYEREEVIGRPSTDFLTEQSRQYATNYFLPLFFEQGYIEDVEYQFVKKNGEIIEVLLSAILEESGGIKRSLAVIVDVTARNKLATELTRYQNRLQGLIAQRTQALANSERRMRTIFDCAPMGIVELDLDGRFRLANQKYADILDCKLADLITKSIQDFTHPADLDTAATLLAQLKAGKIFLASFDQRCLRMGGSEIWIHLEMSLVRDGQGEAEYLIAIIEDIDQRKRLDESLRISERRLAQAQAIANIGVWQWDIRADQTYWSEETFKIFGIPQDGIQPNSETFLSLLHPDDVAIAQDNIQRMFAGEQISRSEYRIITPAGEVRVLQDYHELIRDENGEPIYISGAVQDITEMRQTMIALQESEARLAKSQAIAHLGHWEWNLVKNQLLWSDEFYRIFDFEPQAIAPNFDTFIEMVHVGDRHRIEAAIEVLKRGESVYGFEYRITTAKGREKIVIEHVAPLRNEAGEVTHFSGTLQDITTFKHTLNALQASETRLAKSQAIAHVGSWEWDLATNRMIWSDEKFRIFDLEPQSVEPSYDLVRAMVIPEDRPRLEATLPTLMAGEKVHSLEYRIITPEGRQKIVFEHAEPVRNEQGEITHLSGTLQDITTFKQTLNALQASETRLAKSQAIAHVGSWEWNLTTNELIWSDELFRLFDLEPHSIEPSFDLFLEMLDEGDRPAVEAVMQQLNAGETIAHFEYKIISAEGRKKTFLTHATVTRNDQGEMTYFSGTTQDITAFKETLSALQESETRFRELVENIEESFWINPPDPTEVLYVSPAYEKIWGRSCQSLINDGDTWLEAVHPDDRDRQIAALSKMAAGELFDEKYRIVRPDGEVRWVHARSAQVRDESGQLLRHLGSVRDITEIKEIELELRLSESRFRSMFDQAALGIAQIEMAGRFHVVNQAFCDLVGYTQAELAQMTWQQITYPDDVQKCQPGFEQILSRETHSFNLEKRYIHKDGHLIWVKAIASFIYDENDQPQYILGLVEDITTQKATAIALNESQNRYQELVEGVPAIIYQFSTKRQGIFYSSQLQQILGYEPEFLLQRPTLWYNSIHPDDVHQVNEIFATLQADKNFEVEYRICDAAGQWRWFYDCSFSVKQVAADEFVIDGFALDITERKSFDLALRHRLNLEMVIADISHLMIVETNLDLKEVLALLGQTFNADRMSVMLCEPNTATFKRLKAWAATTDLDLHLEQLELADYPWWLQQWQEQRRILLSRDRPLPESAVKEREFLATINVQGMIWMPIQDQQGHPWGYIECSSTQNNHLLWSKEDADLLAIAGNLIYNYCERQKARHQLETAKEAAEIANYAKNQFLTNMSHELRTPLNAILGFTQLMEQSKTLPDVHREHLAIVRRSGKHLLTLLNDILNLAKFERGTLKLNKTLFNLHSLLNDLSHMYSLEVERKHLNFEVQWDDTIPRYITADQAKLHSVLIHLLSNALKFTDSGSVTMSVAAIAENPLKLRFSVSDTGIGIPKTELPKLFDNFVKLEAGDRLGQGSGLGLALSQKLVNLMGSEIIVSSRPKQGSCFSFDLICETTAQSLPVTSQYQMITEDSPITLNPTDLRNLPSTWREAFYNAALSARVKQLEQLIMEIPPESKAIANALNILSRKLEFEKLAALTKPERGELGIKN